MEDKKFTINIHGKEIPVVFGKQSKELSSEEMFCTPLKASKPDIAYYKWTTNLSLTDRGIMITIWRGNTQWNWWSKYPLTIEKKVHARS